MSGSDWLYARQAARALAGAGPAAGTEDLYIHFGHFEVEPDPGPIGEGALRRAQRALDDRVLSLASLSDGLRVADVGCGVGGTLANVAQRHRGLTLWGVNVDPAQLAAARARVSVGTGSTLTWVVASALSLPLEDASLDRVLAVECLPHFGSRARFFHEAARVLAPGGRLAWTDFVPAGLARARAAGALPQGFEEATRGLGPFEDLWGEGPDLEAQLGATPLALVERVDATRETLPTYRALLRRSVEDVVGDPAAPLEERGLAALGWAQARGLVRMEYFAARR